MKQINNILAAQVLRNHLPELNDGAYKIAIEIAIEVLYQNAIEDWNSTTKECNVREYLGMTNEEYDYWILGEREN